MMDEPGRREGGDGEGPAPRRDSQRGAAGTSAGANAGVGLQFAVSIIISVYAGQWLDRRFDTAPWLMLLALLLGAGGTFYSIYRKLMADLQRDEERRKR